MAVIERFKTSAPVVVGATRFLAGGLFACHGGQKLLLAAIGGLPSGALAPAVWITGLIELVSGALIARRWV